MNIPSYLPLDKLYKILFFGALIVFVYLLKIDLDTNENRNNLVDKMNKIVDDTRNDSLERALLRKRISKSNIQLLAITESKDRNIVINRLAMDSSSLEKMNGEHIIKRAQFARLKSEVKIIDDDEAGFNAEVFLMLVFYVLACTGLIIWVIVDVGKHEEENRKVNIETKNIPCQSCGMTLKYDHHPYLEMELCSECFNGTSYKEPELTIEEMIIKVSKQMKEQKIGQKNISKHIKKMKKMYRWNNDLKWKL